MSTNFGVQDKQGGGRPSSMLEVYMHAISSPVGDNFLDQSNLGLGNYSAKEYWMQIQSFRNGLYADAAMSRKILNRAIYETKRELARDVYHDRAPLTGPGAGERSEQEYIDTYADTIWNNIGDDLDDRIRKQVAFIEKYSSIDRNWVPPQWRMLKMRHEASRSKGARLIDNLFERVREVKDLTPNIPELE